jgi:hypothetical protein
MRFDTNTAERLTSQMGGGDRDTGATLYTVLYQWACNGLLPLVLHWGMHVMLQARREWGMHVMLQGRGEDRPFPFRLELVANGLFGAVVLARFFVAFLSLFSVKLVWFYLAWSEPWPTVESGPFTDFFINCSILVPTFWIFVWFVHPDTRITRDDVVTFSRILRDANRSTSPPKMSVAS